MASPASHDHGTEDHGLIATIECFQRDQGRDDAFRRIYEAFHPPLMRFFRRKGLNAEDCFDLTQETFLGIYRGLEAYEDRQRFAAWVFRIATTVWLKRLRAGAAAKRGAPEVSRDAMENPEPTLAVPGRQLDQLIAAERREALRAAVEELPEQGRHCLTLRLYHQLSYQEIAVVKKLSVETVKAHLSRARKRLRGQLSGFELDEQES